MPHTPLPRVRTSAEWVAYYTANAEHLRVIPWELGAGITPDEAAAIIPSLRAWQLGESSDGKHLTATAERYAAQTGDPEFVTAIRLFIAEEQRHGNDMGRFLDLAGIPRAQADWGDSLFRFCRHALPSMEVWATPVVMTETHALIYYNAVRRATGSPVLRTLCEQMLADEVPHIRFQCERLAVLHRNRPRWLMALTGLFHRVFFAGITLAIWVGHRRVYRAGGYTFGSYWSAVWRKMRHAWQLMRPDAYEWEPTGEPVASPECLSSVAGG